MVNNIKVQPSEKGHIFKKRSIQQYPCLRKMLLLLKRKMIVYPLTFFIIGLVLGGYGYSTHGNLRGSSIFHPVLRAVDQASDFFLMASIITIALHLPTNINNFYDFFTSLYPTESIMLVGPLLAMRKHHFWRNFLISNVCILCLVGLNASFFLFHFGWTWYRYLIFRDVEFYLYNLVLLLLLALARKLEIKFAELNELLKYKTEHFLKSNSKKYDNVQANQLNVILQSEHFYSIRTFRTMHYDMCKLVKSYNSMFGRIILSAIICSIANILAKVTFIIYFCVTPKTVVDTSRWSWYVGIICFWILTNTGQAFLFSFYGDRITTEGEKTTRICFYLLNKVPFHPKSEEENLVQEELKLLVFQSYTDTPCLCAGGFFNINYKVLGLMMSSITSYLMVIIQFLLRQQANSGFTTS